MRKVVAILSGTVAIGCMVMSNINSRDSNARLHLLGQSGISLGRAELAVEQLSDGSTPNEADAANSKHVEALDRYKEAFISADLRIGGAQLLGNVALIFLVVAIGASAWK